MTNTTLTTPDSLHILTAEPGVPPAVRTRAGLRREVAAALLTLVAFALMIVAALWLVSVNRLFTEGMIPQGALAALAGAGVLWGALRLTRYAIPALLPTAATLTPSGWNAPVTLIGLAVIAVITLASTPLVQGFTLHPHLQFAGLLIGLLLFAAGLANVRRLALPRIVWRDVALVLPILLLALVLRTWGLDTTVRGSIDEMHFSDAVQRFIYGEPQLLNTTSNYLPPSMIYSYWNAGTVEAFGRNFVGLRILNGYIGVLTVLAVYGMMYAMADRKTALIAALILATFPPHIHFSRVAMGQTGDALFGTMFIMFGARALRWNRRADWVWCGICLALTQYFYEGGRLLFPPLAIVWVILLFVFTRFGALRGRWRAIAPGLGAALIATVLIAAPVYISMAANGQPFSARFNESRVGSDYFSSRLADGLTDHELHEIVLRVTDPFLIYTTQPDGTGEFYAGTEPMVLRLLIPIFLLGVAHALWRPRSAIFILIPAVLGASAGNILIANGMMYHRYIMIMPAIAAFMAIGLRFTLPMLIPAGLFSRRITLSDGTPAPASAPPYRTWARVGVGVVAVLTLGIAVVQAQYYYGPFLREYNISFRAAKPYRDGIDAVLRAAAEVPASDDAQIWLISRDEPDRNVPQLFLEFLGVGSYPLDQRTRERADDAFFAQLPRERSYAFFLDPDDTETLARIRRYFTLDGPRYTRADIPVNKAYVLYYAPEAANQTLPEGSDAVLTGGT